MNCWRTTVGATMTNLGATGIVFLLSGATGLFDLSAYLTRHEIGWLLFACWVCRTVGTQWQGHASADQQEVKKQLGLNPDGTKPTNET